MEVQENLEQKLFEMARARGLEIGGVKTQISHIKEVASSCYGSVVAVLVYVM